MVIRVPSLSRVMSMSMSTGSWKNLGHASASVPGSYEVGGKANTAMKKNTSSCRVAATLQTEGDLKRGQSQSRGLPTRDN